MIKEFWQEVRQERKDKRRLKKENKKNKLTGEEKATKIFGILFGFFVFFGSIIFACNNMSLGDLSDINWGSAIGLSDEMVEELEKPVDENLLLINGRIGDDDYTNFINAWINAGADESCFDEDSGVTDGEEGEEVDLSGLYINSELYLSSRVIGAWCKETNIDIGYSSNVDILDMLIYKENNNYYMSTISYCNLKNILGIEGLPSIYLKSVSEVAILSGKLTVLSTGLYINALDKDMNEEIVNKINDISDDKLSSLVNDMIVTAYINPLKDLMRANIYLSGNGIIFVPVGA